MTAAQKLDAFGNTEQSHSGEVQALAISAQAEAEVKARWAIAQRVPRNIDQVRVDLLKECERPGFADVAKYSKPVGGQKVVGPSIRFVEAALRCMRNVFASTTVVSEDRTTRRLQVMVTDLEANVSWPRQITLEKTVERRSREGREVVYTRLNTKGETVFVVIATEDELANKEAAAVSKAIRTAGLRVIPGDLIEEAMRKVDQVREAGIRKDPAGERKKMVDAFMALGVKPEQLVEYLGHALDACQPVEIAELRDIHAALREGETTWRAVMEGKREADPVGPPPVTPPAPSTQTVDATPTQPAASENPEADLQERLRQSVANAQAPKPTPPTAEQPRPTPPPPSGETGEQIISELRLLMANATSKRSDLNKFASRITKYGGPDKAEVQAVYAEAAQLLAGRK
ncbi:MAG: hypothetical protein JNM17_06700 [Archangium sp.]|nr:hypothetical protein [Archangium sp.]